MWEVTRWPKIAWRDRLGYVLQARFWTAIPVPVDRSIFGSLIHAFKLIDSD
jgi:hypothetical protein